MATVYILRGYDTYDSEYYTIGEYPSYSEAMAQLSEEKKKTTDSLEVLAVEVSNDDD